MEAPIKKMIHCDVTGKFRGVCDTHKDCQAFISYASLESFGKIQYSPYCMYCGCPPSTHRITSEGIPGNCQAPNCTCSKLNPIQVNSLRCDCGHYSATHYTNFKPQPEYTSIPPRNPHSQYPPSGQPHAPLPHRHYQNEHQQQFLNPQLYHPMPLRQPNPSHGPPPAQRLPSNPNQPHPNAYRNPLSQGPQPTQVQQHPPTHSGGQNPNQHQDQPHPAHRNPLSQGPQPTQVQQHPPTHSGGQNPNQRQDQPHPDAHRNPLSQGPQPTQVQQHSPTHSGGQNPNQHQDQPHPDAHRNPLSQGPQPTQVQQHSPTHSGGQNLNQHQDQPSQPPPLEGQQIGTELESIVANFNDQKLEDKQPDKQPEQNFPSTQCPVENCVCTALCLGKSGRCDYCDHTHLP